MTKIVWGQDLVGGGIKGYLQGRQGGGLEVKGYSDHKIKNTKNGETVVIFIFLIFTLFYILIPSYSLPLLCP